MADKSIQNDHKRLTENMKFLQKLYSRKELCLVAGISSVTWGNRLEEPWTWKYGELRALARYCKVDFAQLVDGQLCVR